MTVRWLLQNLSSSEVTEWQEYAVLKGEEARVEANKRKAQRGRMG